MGFGERGRRTLPSSSCSSFIGWSHASSLSTLLSCTAWTTRPLRGECMKDEVMFFFGRYSLSAKSSTWPLEGSQPRPRLFFFPREARARVRVRPHFFFRIRSSHWPHHQLRLVGGPMTLIWWRNRHVMFHPLSCFLFIVGSGCLDIG